MKSNDQPRKSLDPLHNICIIPLNIQCMIHSCLAHVVLLTYLSFFPISNVGEKWSWEMQDTSVHYIESCRCRRSFHGIIELNCRLRLPWMQTVIWYSSVSCSWIDNGLHLLFHSYRFYDCWNKWWWKKQINKSIVIDILFRIIFTWLTFVRICRGYATIFFDKM